MSLEHHIFLIKLSPILQLMKDTNRLDLEFLIKGPQ